MFVQGAEQRDDALGFVKMPQGYELWQIDNHWMWMETRTQRESEIHWNKWAIYRSAQRDSERLVQFPSGEEIT